MLGSELVLFGRQLRQAPEESAKPIAQQLVHAEPGRIAVHQRLLPEPELLRLEVEVQVVEELLAFIEGRRAAFEEHVQACQSLLPVQQEKRVPIAGADCTPDLRRPVGLPYQEMTGRTLLVERTSQRTDLIAFPHVAPLELGEKDLPVADLTDQLLYRARHRHPSRVRSPESTSTPPKPRTIPHRAAVESAAFRAKHLRSRVQEMESDSVPRLLSSQHRLRPAARRTGRV